MGNSIWTNERVDLLRQLFAGKKHSTKQMAGILGAGISRCAVASKLIRLGLTRPVARQHPCGGTAGSFAFKVIHGIKAQQNGTAAPDVPLPEFAADDSGCLKIPFSALERGDRKCRWPFDAPPEVDGSFVYCGLHTPEDASYCVRHARISCQPAPPRQRNAA